MLKHLTHNITGEPYLIDTQTGKQYRRAVCALAWPWHPLPGWVVVLAEYRNRPAVVGEARHIDVMAEVESASPEELIHTAERYLRQYHAPRIITPDDDQRIALIDLENDQRRAEHKPPLRTESPVMWHGKGEGGLLPYYTALLHARTVDAKTLHFGHSHLPTAVQPVLADADNGRRPMLQWPAVCALCWALERIDLQPLRQWRGGERNASGPADPVGGY